MFSNIGALELGIIAVLILLLFGARKLPEFARGIVQAKEEFKASFSAEDGEASSES